MATNKTLCAVDNCAFFNLDHHHQRLRVLYCIILKNILSSWIENSQHIYLLVAVYCIDHHMFIINVHDHESESGFN